MGGKIQKIWKVLLMHEWIEERGKPDVKYWDGTIKFRKIVLPSSADCGYHHILHSKIMSREIIITYQEDKYIKIREVVTIFQKYILLM